MEKTLVFERGDLLYLVGPVTPFNPDAAEVDEFAFAQDLKQLAPNENLIWMRGQYVEADKPNLNGAQWTADEIAIKSLTPMLMPVTVMHDPRTAVGLIADTALRTPDKDNVPRARIDTTLGLWGHRFPDVVEEAMDNYRRGELMQSMECRKGWYECGSCSKRYFPLPDDAEKKNWCEHLRGETATAENGKPVRRLGAVTFTGTGLIFGTRGATGAYTEAHLDVFQEEVAEAHERTRRSTSRRPRSTKTQMELSQERYDELVADQNKLKALEPRVKDLEDTAGKVPDLEKKVTDLEAEKAKAEQERDTEKAERTKLEETASAEKLATERLDALGKDFKVKLGDFTRGQLQEAAKTASDDEWANKLKELSEAYGVESDAGGKGEPETAGTTHTREETARAKLGGRENRSEEPSSHERRSVVGGLAKSLSNKS